MSEDQVKYGQAESDTALARKMGGFIKSCRIHRNFSQAYVAERAGISRSTLSLLENGEPVSVSTLLRVMRILDITYLFNAWEFSEPESPIEIAKRELRKRRRAGRNKGGEDLGIPSTW